ncbi:MAG: RHS repeat protein, partial [Nannocystaceae bacterium]|nr:RHS repeat protein [Nannocystaceae bacterium]
MAVERMRLAVIGDLVFGMASYAPPVAFVGEIGDEAAEAAERMTRGLEQSQGGKTKAPLVVTINGQPAATQDVIAIEMGPGGDAALPIAWQPKISIGQKHSLLHEGMFQVGSGGSLNSSAARQQVVTAPPAPKGEQSEQAPAPTARSGSRGGSSRSDYSLPSAMQTMLSRCSSARAADLAPPQYACLVGDPVDVATGAVVTDATDYRSVAPPLAFTRHYASNRSDVDSPFGFGWSHNFDQAVWLEVGRVVVRDQHGRQIEFDCVPLRDGVARAGDELRDPTGRIRLRCHGRHHWELLDPSQILHFGPIPGTASSDTDRGFARLTKVIVPGQPLTELTYDAHARLHRIAVDGKAVIELRYDQDDHILALNRDAARFSYSLDGDLAEAYDAAGSARSYEYAGHLLVRETNRRGGSFYYGYDSHGCAAKCIRTWGVGGRLHRVLAYDSDTTTVTDSLGHATLYERSAVGLVSRIVDPHGDATTYQYNDALQLTAVGLPDGTSRRDDYDDEGRLICQRRPGGETWKMTYDAAGHLVRGIDPVGGQWHFTYDFAGQLSRVQDPEGHVTRLEYETGQLCRLIDPLGVVTSLQLGRGDEVTQLVLPGDIEVEFEHDSRGRLSRTRSQV